MNSLEKYSISPLLPFVTLWRFRELILKMSYREVVGRYKGSLIGILWSFLNPVFMLIVYTFVFSVVFQARWGVEGESRSTFALILFAGLIVFNFFAECVNKSPTLILSNANYVKKVVFPLEILPWVSIISAFFHALVSVLVWMFFYLLEVGLPNSSALLFPLVFLPLIMFVLGLSWGLSALGVYIRDIGQIVGIITTVLMFLSPIFFPVEALPEAYRPLLELNPLSPAISQLRDVLFFGNVPSIFDYISYFVKCFIVCCLGFILFQKTRRGFADVI